MGAKEPRAKNKKRHTQQNQTFGAIQTANNNFKNTNFLDSENNQKIKGFQSTVYDQIPSLETQHEMAKYMDQPNNPSRVATPSLNGFHDSTEEGITQTMI